MSHPELQPDRPKLLHRLYLGDGVYVGLGRWGHVHLWTTDGVEVTNNVVLGRHELESLMRWLESRKGEDK